MHSISKVNVTEWAPEIFFKGLGKVPECFISCLNLLDKPPTTMKWSESPDSLESEPPPFSKNAKFMNKHIDSSSAPKSVGSFPESSSYPFEFSISAASRPWAISWALLSTAPPQK